MNVHEADIKKYRVLEDFYTLLYEYTGELRYGEFYSSVADEFEAKCLLIRFFESLEKIKPTEVIYYSGIVNEYYSFESYMYKFYCALSKKQYCVACGELLELCLFEPVMQQRIYYNLLDIYNRFLKLEVGSLVRKKDK